MEWNKKNWIIVASIVLITIGSINLILNPDEFSIILKDGTIKAKYSEGNLKVYSGRYVAFEDYINLYYWNGKGYTTMYKARGDKYSNLSYYQEKDTTFVKQTIYYSKGNLTRYFEITEYKIKESFEWNPNDKNLRVYFKWNYDKLDEFAEKQVYLDKNIKGTRAMMDFNIINNWEKEIDNIVRAERFQNGRVTIRTRVFEGNASFDPEVLFEKDITKLTKDDVFKKLILNDAKNTKAIFSVENPMNTVNIKKEDIKINFNEVCGYIKTDKLGNKKYKLLINETCIGTKEVHNNKTNITTHKEYAYTCFKDFNEIKAEDLRDIKIDVNISDIVMDYCPDGTYGYQIDWIPSITLNDTIKTITLDKLEWEWWNVSSGIYSGEKCSYGAKEADAYGLAFSTNGTYFYILGYGTNAIHRYIMTTPWNLSTCSYSQSTGSYGDASIGLYFKPDGTKYYFVKWTTDTAYEYTMSAIWDITTGSLTYSKSIPEDTVPRSLTLSSDGNHMYVGASTDNEINQYDLSIPWNVSSASYVYTFSTSGKFPGGLYIKQDDGTKMYMGSAPGVIEYDLSIAYNISTASYSRNLSTVAQDTGTNGLWFKSDGSKFFLLGSQYDYVYAYDLPAAPVPNTAPTIIANATSPSMVYSNTDFKLNLTITDPEADTLTGYVQFYINGSSSGAEQSQEVTNNSNTNVANLSSPFNVGDTLIAEFWAGDGTVNTTLKYNTTEVTIQNHIPVIIANVTSPTIVYTNTNFNLNLTITDGDADTLTGYVQFYVNGSVSGSEQSTSPVTNDTNTLIGTLGYGNFSASYTLIAEYWASDGINTTSKVNATQVTVSYFIMKGTVKDSNALVINNANVIIMNQTDNTVIGTTTSNSTGGWEYNISNIGTYLVIGYDPNNSTIDGDADPHITIP